MTLQDKLKTDLKSAIKARDDAQKNAIRVVMGEMARSDKKQLLDDEIIKILKKLIKSEKEMLEKSGRGAANIDFSTYKNKMQAMGTIMAHFGASADGNTVKQVLQNFSG